MFQPLERISWILREEGPFGLDQIPWSRILLRRETKAAKKDAVRLLREGLLPVVRIHHVKRK
jgi:hypothetical protein